MLFLRDDLLKASRYCSQPFNYIMVLAQVKLMKLVECKVMLAYLPFTEAVPKSP